MSSQKGVVSKDGHPTKDFLKVSPIVVFIETIYYLVLVPGR